MSTARPLRRCSLPLGGRAAGPRGLDEHRAVEDARRPDRRWHPALADAGDARAGGARQGLRLHYQLIDLDAAHVGADKLPVLIEAARIMGFAGLNITYPCKQAVIPLLDDLSDEARAMGAVNTVVFRDGRAIGHNTDGSGWAWGFRRTLPQADLSRVVLLGAGGAGSAIAHAVLRLGAHRLVIVDREADRARIAAAQLNSLYGARPRDRRRRCGHCTAWRHRADPCHAHRHGQAARAAAAGRTAAPRAVGGRDRLLPARHRVAAARHAHAAVPRWTAAPWRWGRRSAPSSSSPVALPTRRASRRISGSCWPRAAWPEIEGEAHAIDTRPRSHWRAAQPAGPGRHRVHRIRDLPAAGAGRGAGDDGLPAGRAAPLARGAAVPPGRR